MKKNSTSLDTRETTMRYVSTPAKDGYNKKEIINKC